MRNTLILTAAALAAFCGPALAQSNTAQPVMPAPRDYPNPNANMTPMNNGAIVPEGRAVAPNGPVGETVPNGNTREKARSGANGS